MFFFLFVNAEKAHKIWYFQLGNVSLRRASSLYVTLQLGVITYIFFYRQYYVMENKSIDPKGLAEYEDLIYKHSIQ